eukprot:scaffold1959_cov243-Pinguiococcus_pyrenoidosus.AAC.6
MTEVQETRDRRTAATDTREDLKKAVRPAEQSKQHGRGQSAKTLARNSQLLKVPLPALFTFQLWQNTCGALACGLGACPSPLGGFAS